MYVIVFEGSVFWYSRIPDFIIMAVQILNVVVRPDPSILGRCSISADIVADVPTQLKGISLETSHKLFPGSPYAELANMPIQVNQDLLKNLLSVAPGVKAAYPPVVIKTSTQVFGPIKLSPQIPFYLSVGAFLPPPTVPGPGVSYAAVTIMKADVDWSPFDVSVPVPLPEFPLQFPAAPEFPTRSDTIPFPDFAPSKNIQTPVKFNLGIWRLTDNLSRTADDAYAKASWCYCVWRAITRSMLGKISLLVSWGFSLGWVFLMGGLMYSVKPHGGLEILGLISSIFLPMMIVTSFALLRAGAQVAAKKMSYVIRPRSPAEILASITAGCYASTADFFKEFRDAGIVPASWRGELRLGWEVSSYRYERDHKGTSKVKVKGAVVSCYLGTVVPGEGALRDAASPGNIASLMALPRVGTKNAKTRLVLYWRAVSDDLIDTFGSVELSPV